MQKELACPAKTRRRDLYPKDWRLASAGTAERSNSPVGYFFAILAGDNYFAAKAAFQNIKRQTSRKVKEGEMDVNEMCAELFGKHGLDDGGPVAEIIQKKFESHLESRLPHWEFNRINTSHNPRIVQARPVHGEWIRLDGCADLVKLPAELRKAIKEFLPTFKRMFFVLCCLHNS